MSDLSKDQINELVSRVTATVAQEMKVNEAAFSVNDLRAQATDLSKIGDAVAWEISYKTSKAGFTELAGGVTQPGAAVAWEISYKTSRAGFERGGPVLGG